MKIVYYFTADWCSPCKKTKPIVEDFNREQNKIKFQIIDADYEVDLVAKFGVKSIPTFIFIEEGNEIDRITGAQTRESLEKFINDR